MRVGSLFHSPVGVWGCWDIGLWRAAAMVGGRHLLAQQGLADHVRPSAARLLRTRGVVLSHSPAIVRNTPVAGCLCGTTPPCPTRA